MYLYIETLKQRLDAINQLRLERASTAMSAEFRQVYSLLPVLLHYHHPMMPGYINGNVPYGVCFFVHDESQKSYLDDLESKLEHAIEQPANGQLPITGIYSMGSTSSIGQSSCSDLDIWVCHQSWLDNDERLLLQRKCTLIEQWASALGIEVNFFSY
ncbi:hypothetical protein [Photorhabdus temperata]|uniref:hypothetical protein n=1 Tax=Photorhabdus temperata TaxID=574560 RepID=UPI0004032D0A